jgi:hypothetical protein
MKPAAILCIFCLAVGFGLQGCTSEPTMPKEELSAKTDLNGIAQRAFQEKRTWETLDQKDRDAYISFYKNEAKAKEYFQKAYDGMKFFFGGGGGVPGQGQGAPGGS